MNWISHRKLLPVGMKNQIALLIILSVCCWILSVCCWATAAIAAPPDPETETLIRERYNLLLFTSRSCAYFANPKTLESSGDNRFVWVLNAGNEDTGTLCRGVFRFLWLNVNCQTKNPHLHGLRPIYGRAAAQQNRICG
ncbi:hypothetical protein [Leptothermofonsia sp. ETS-13]|uniref:hypothetical protein n=1 Tax=Leptothermofonsia sp. ETS-13 TaxID=3035696 RepID=UPI003BA0E352